MRAASSISLFRASGAMRAGGGAHNGIAARRRRRQRLLYGTSSAPQHAAEAIVHNDKGDVVGVGASVDNLGNPAAPVRGPVIPGVSGRPAQRAAGTASGADLTGDLFEATAGGAGEAAHRRKHHSHHRRHADHHDHTKHDDGRPTSRAASASLSDGLTVRLAMPSTAPRRSADTRTDRHADSNTAGASRDVAFVVGSSADSPPPKPRPFDPYAHSFELRAMAEHSNNNHANANANDASTITVPLRNTNARLNDDASPHSPFPYAAGRVRGLFIGVGCSYDSSDAPPRMASADTERKEERRAAMDTDGSATPPLRPSPPARAVYEGRDGYLSSDANWPEEAALLAEQQSPPTSPRDAAHPSCSIHHRKQNHTDHQQGQVAELRLQSGLDAVLSVLRGLQTIKLPLSEACVLCDEWEEEEEEEEDGDGSDSNDERDTVRRTADEDDGYSIRETRGGGSSVCGTDAAAALSPFPAPTRANIVAHLAWLSRDARPGDVLLLYFSGVCFVPDATESTVAASSTADEGSADAFAGCFIAPSGYDVTLAAELEATEFSPSSAAELLGRHLIAGADVLAALAEGLASAPCGGRGVRLTIVMDCAHVPMQRLPQPSQLIGKEGSFLPPIPLPYALVEGRKHTRPVASRKGREKVSSSLSDLCESLDIVMFSTTAATSLSSKKLKGLPSCSNGALTDAFVSTLTTTTGLSYASLLDVMRRRSGDTEGDFAFSASRRLKVTESFSFFSAV